MVSTLRIIHHSRHHLSLQKNESLHERIMENHVTGQLTIYDLKEKINWNRVTAFRTLSFFFFSPVSIISRLVRAFSPMNITPDEWAEKATRAHPGRRHEGFECVEQRQCCATFYAFWSTTDRERLFHRLAGFSFFIALEKGTRGRGKSWTRNWLTCYFSNGAISLFFSFLFFLSFLFSRW